MSSQLITLAVAVLVLVFLFRIDLGLRRIKRIDRKLDDLDQRHADTDRKVSKLLNGKK